jgi:hypothetical protein
MQNTCRIVVKKLSRILALIFSICVAVAAHAQNGPGVCSDGSAIAPITRALDLCSQMTQVMQQKNGITTMSSEAMARDTNNIDRIVRIAELQLDEAIARYTQSVATQVQREAIQQKRLQIAAAIIGIIGGGAGGGLHLVNNPHLSHFGTALAMGAGITGGSLSLFGGLTKSIPAAQTNGNYVEAFFRSYSTAGAPAANVSYGLVEMSRQLEALENELK